MIILPIEQNSQEWRDWRIGRIMGSKAKGVMPLTRGADRTPKGYWHLLAEKVCVPRDGEDAKLRGHRLEQQAIQEFELMYGKKANLEPGVWQSSFSDDIAISPDAAEPSERPTWAVEVKCLNDADHLMYTIKDKRAKKLDDYSAIAQVPSEYKLQVIQYFVVNEDMQTLFFVLHDENVVVDSYRTHVIEIHRKDIEGDIELSKDTQLATLQSIREDIEEMMNEVDKE